uniref:Uncharacterized protein n=1 Tax=Cacopsylla melanoneura TaxID=428564 RepID=A0A8D8TH24_9HEMI
MPLRNTGTFLGHRNNINLNDKHLKMKIKTQFDTKLHLFVFQRTDIQGFVARRIRTAQTKPNLQWKCDSARICPTSAKFSTTRLKSQTVAVCQDVSVWATQKLSRPALW